MREDLTIETAKLIHIYKVLKLELGTQAQIAKALGISCRTLRNYTMQMRKEGWEIKSNIVTDNPNYSKDDLEFRFATNEERINYLDTRKRVR